jgi:hypothetical protein
MNKRVVLVIVLILLAGSLEHMIDAVRSDPYCEMVTLWQSDADQGIHPNQRRGWAPYRGEEVDCD